MSAQVEFETGGMPTITRHPHEIDEHGQRWTIFIPDSFLIKCKDPNLEIAIWIMRLAWEGGRP